NKVFNLMATYAETAPDLMAQLSSHGARADEWREALKADLSKAAAGFGMDVASTDSGVTVAPRSDEATSSPAPEPEVEPAASLRASGPFAPSKSADVEDAVEIEDVVEDAAEKAAVEKTAAEKIDDAKTDVVAAFKAANAAAAAKAAARLAADDEDVVADAKDEAPEAKAEETAEKAASTAPETEEAVEIDEPRDELEIASEAAKPATAPEPKVAKAASDAPATADAEDGRADEDEAKVAAEAPKAEPVAAKEDEAEDIVAAEADPDHIDAKAEDATIVEEVEILSPSEARGTDARPFGPETLYGAARDLSPLADGQEKQTFTDRLRAQDLAEAKAAGSRAESARDVTPDGDKANADEPKKADEPAADGAAVDEAADAAAAKTSEDKPTRPLGAEAPMTLSVGEAPPVRKRRRFIVDRNRSQPHERPAGPPEAEERRPAAGPRDGDRPTPMPDNFLFDGAIAGEDADEAKLAEAEARFKERFASRDEDAADDADRIEASPPTAPAVDTPAAGPQKRRGFRLFGGSDDEDPADEVAAAPRETAKAEDRGLARLMEAASAALPQLGGDGPRKAGEPGGTPLFALSDAEDFDDDASPGAFARQMGAASLVEALEASAAYLAIVEGKASFERRDVMKAFSEIELEGEATKEAQFKSFRKLMASGSIIRREDGTYALSHKTRFGYETRIRAGAA
ncbi:MAG: hypothetical protein AAF322_05465, partial [Pseudomonadota bacterium]